MAKLWTYRSSSTEASPTLYADGNPIADYTIKGNTVQNGTPSPSNPVDVVGVGELETTGEHAGEYKIPISSGGVTTNIYLGSTQSTRKIKKLVLTGNESGWTISGTGLFYNLTLTDNPRERDAVMSTHFAATSYEKLPIGTIRFGGSQESPTNPLVFNYDDGAIGLEAFKSWLATQYANGTPVTVWYVLATPEAASVNEPLMKIGDYADSITGSQSQISIPTTAGENSITFLTDIQPSQFEVPIEGWYFDNPKKWDGSKWV
jgi:hypothetical protein